MTTTSTRPFRKWRVWRPAASPRSRYAPIRSRCWRRQGEKDPVSFRRTTLRCGLGGTAARSPGAGGRRRKRPFAATHDGARSGQWPGARHSCLRAHDEQCRALRSDQRKGKHASRDVLEGNTAPSATPPRKACLFGVATVSHCVVTSHAHWSLHKWRRPSRRVCAHASGLVVSPDPPPARSCSRRYRRILVGLLQGGNDDRARPTDGAEARALKPRTGDPRCDSGKLGALERQRPRCALWDAGAGPRPGFLSFARASAARREARTRRAASLVLQLEIFISASTTSMPEGDTHGRVGRVDDWSPGPLER